MSKAIGIDIGTFGCRMAVATSRDGADAKMIDGPDGTPSTPSTVAFTDQGVVIGAAAEEQAPRFPEQTIFGFVRLLGRKFHSPEVDWLRTCCPYTVVAAANGDARVHVDDRDYSPQELLSFVLERLKACAERQLESDVTDAVLAVSGCLDDLQRRAVLDAATLAGFSGATLVNGAAAAAISRAAELKTPRRIAVVDLGAGKLDVSLADIQGSSVKLLASAGHQMLGGDDIDRRMVLHFVDTFEQATGVDATDSPSALVRFRQRAMAAKLELSAKTKTDAIAIPKLIERSGKSIGFEHAGVTRRRLVELMVEELASLKEPCFWVFEDAGLGTDDVEEVMAIGGVTRMPAVLSALKYLFRATPTCPDDANVMVALGAARVAAMRHGEDKSKNRDHFRDLIGISTGIKVRGGKRLPVVSRNTAIPAREVQMFQTAPGHQDSAVFELFQGEHDLATDNTYLGRFAVDDLPTEGQFPVAFHVNKSGILKVARIDQRTGEERDVPLVLSGGLTKDELDSLLAQRSGRMAPSRAPSGSARPAQHTPRGPTPGGPTPEGRDHISVDESPSRVFRRERPGGTHSDAPTVARAPAPPKRHEPPRPIEVGADSLVGTTLGQRYVIEAIVADGGMGRVYRAHHKLLKKRFAIKVLHPELAANRDIAERFVREAQAASSIQSDHVVDISDFGVLEDGTGYFVMEYLDGDTLESILDKRGPLPAAMLRSIGMQVADGLRGAHEERIVHRDLKPANIVLMERPDHPYFCKILDFGIAKNPTSDSSGLITRVGIMMGTPHYMAPEQIDGKVDARSDIYALGLVLFEIATATPPFDAESVAELLAKQKWEPPPRIHDVCPIADCPPAYEEVIRRCLEKDPADRYQTAKEAAEALQALPV